MTPQHDRLPTARLLEMAAPYNPRKIDDATLERLRHSIRVFGFVEPVIVNVEFDRIVGGHQRVKAAHAEGLVDLPVVYVRLDEVRERQLNVALNKITGDWDDEKLRDLLGGLQLDGADLPLTGFSDKELRKLLATATAGTASDEIPEPPATPMTQPGDLWLLGSHRLVCGDSSHAEVVRRVCDGAPIVATVTDPPYGVDYDRKSEKTGYQGPEHYRETHRADALGFMAHAPGDLLVMTYPIDVHFFALADAMRVHGYRFRREAVWCKNRATVSLAGGLCQKHEPILICTRKGAQLRLHHEAGQSTVFHVDVIQKQERHPTERPMALWQPLVELASARGEHVFEPFSGSGTTIVACEQTGRIAHAIELAPGFCDVAVQRWEEHTGGSARLAREAA